MDGIKLFPGSWLKIKTNLILGEVVEIRVLFDLNFYCRDLGDNVPSQAGVAQLKAMGEPEWDVERRKGSSLQNQCHCPPPLKKERDKCPVSPGFREYR